MSTGLETIEVIDPWLYETLSADEVIVATCGLDRIVSELSDLGSIEDSRPFVTWQMSSSRDIGLVQRGGARAWNDALYHVRAIVKGTSYMPILPVAQRIEALLNGAQVTTVNGDISCVREQLVQYPEQAGSSQFRHLGAIYRFRANSH